jgi:hypothetical protein
VSPFYLTFEYYFSEFVVVGFGGFIDITVGADDTAASYYFAHLVIVIVE